MKLVKVLKEYTSITPEKLPEDKQKVLNLLAKILNQSGYDGLYQRTDGFLVWFEVYSIRLSLSDIQKLSKIKSIKYLDFDNGNLNILF